MAIKDLIAEKGFSYLTRRLKAGDSFEAKGPDAKVLIALKLAREPREPGEIEAPPASLVERLAAPAEVATPTPRAPRSTPPPSTRKRRTRKSPAKKG